MVEGVESMEALLAARGPNFGEEIFVGRVLYDSMKAVVYDLHCNCCNLINMYDTHL